ncbi:MAG: YaaR family protein [Treponema sp.]|nr:YaaR family protein [Treponema sp.]
MANINFPDGSSPLFNPSAYGESSAEARKAKAQTPGKSGKNKKTTETKNSFTSFFEKAVLGKVKELPLSEDSLHELLEDVHTAGDTLSKRPFPPEIAAYKEAVRNFVHYVVENSYDTEELSSKVKFIKVPGGLDIQKPQQYKIIRVVDSKLETFAAEILRGQLSQLQILEKLDEIKGLLVDLLE